MKQDADNVRSSTAAAFLEASFIASLMVVG